MHSFFSNDNLVSLVQPIEPGFPYFRPFILHGEPEQVDLFLIGINPATSVYPNNGVMIDYWIETIMNHNLYNQRFSSNGQTRIGINGLLSLLKIIYPFSIIETNINAFPTSKKGDLKKRKFLLSAYEGANIFKKVLFAHELSIIILFGKEAKVFACRLLMYYGHEGKTFKKFINGLIPFIIKLKREKIRIPRGTFY